MSVEHDEEYLEKYTKREVHKTRLSKGIYVGIHQSVVECKKYHEHMEQKRQAENDRLQSLAVEQVCKICNYSFQGLVPCKCRMRVSADVFQAVVDKINRNTGE